MNIVRLFTVTPQPPVPIEAAAHSQRSRRILDADAMPCPGRYTLPRHVRGGDEHVSIGVRPRRQIGANGRLAFESQCVEPFLMLVHDIGQPLCQHSGVDNIVGSPPL
ncbi:hypothetical protein [uncultured Bifidobacterium sp.]|uniref:hypothetical protein n=1 Tax=uncultured Bifidobacterium sp. TaxID=165187 RepID=UPI002589AAE2|nr:hypothetical protein [uncultured Bifidobacterium sp.]